MLEISDRAARQIAETCRRRHAPAGGYRIRRDPLTGDDALKVGFAPRPEPGDRVFEQGDANVYVSSDAMDSVDGWILDSRTIEHRTTLYLRRPRQPTTQPTRQPVPDAASSR